jgi:uncharacterized protein with GYD domain
MGVLMWLCARATEALFSGVGTKKQRDPKTVRKIVDELGLDWNELPSPASRVWCLNWKEDIAMLTFVMLTRLSPEAVRSPEALEDLERRVMERVRKECPDVEWVNSYAILGPCDYLDIFRAKDVETASKVSTLIRTFGHAHTEIWTATGWDRFKEIVRAL